MYNVVYSVHKNSKDINNYTVCFKSENYYTAFKEKRHHNIQNYKLYSNRRVFYCSESILLICKWYAEPQANKQYRKSDMKNNLQLSILMNCGR